MDWNLLRSLCAANAISGSEHNVYPIVTERLKKYGFEIKTDYIGNIIAKIPDNKEKLIKIVLDAHLDEVGMMVSKIENNGFLRFITIGGIDPDILPGTPVVIYGKKEINGIIGSVPPHIKSKNSQSGIQAEDLYIDTGLFNKDIEDIIAPGDIITFLPYWHENNHSIMSKALDNRVGVFILLSLLETVAGISQESECDVYLVFSSQEETGMKGAIPVSNMLNPDIVIILEGTVSNDVPGTSYHKMLARCGEGPEIRLSDSKFLANRPLTNFIIDIAKKNDINHQIIIKKAGGTNAAAYQTGGKTGALTSAVSVPVRYLHSPASLAFKEDIKNSYALIKHVLFENNNLNQLVTQFLKDFDKN